MWKSLVVALPLAAVAFAGGARFGGQPAHVESHMMMSQLCGDEAPFMAENQTAMHRMMSDMDIAPSGDVDRDFSAMMIPHHRGAIAMAQAELRYGRNESLRRIAQEIIVDQQQEIAVMRLALDQPPPPATTTAALARQQEGNLP
ncbi:DUF305 domain-containing protein [Bradyrhizobium guangzhouense]|uniref:DUF305 domain-containing protein n=1 Tax=Bradyrhizobium guangzhouense TaxID=1325095 RepID=A0AAE5X1B8_9BRAD|nr:DUF305 domain-containing protein [Bradyrhizobium guangzhouense]RXH12751.1 DUF305 domain-containing protein [Bradyrhizobium guangzhouense]RXH12933.1 DUF305 domain-containing protein [Bradyrhizobium guangzhouense]